MPQTEAIDAGRVDIGFLHPPVPSAAVALHTVLRQRFIAVVPEGHRLADEERIRPHRLAHEPFVIFTRERGSGLYDRIIAVCNREGFSPRVGQYANQMQTIVSLVATGVGVAIVPHSVQRMGRAGVAFCELEGVEAEAILAAAWHRENENPMLDTFLSVVKARTD